MTKLTPNCKNEDHFKHLVKMRTIHNHHYENEDHFKHLVKMRSIRIKHYENEDGKGI